jgi:hypothetical protein
MFGGRGGGHKNGKLLLVLDLEVVEKGLEVVLGCEACIK